MGLLDSLKGLFSKGQATIENTVDAAKHAVENSGETLNSIKEQVSEMGTNLQEQGKELMDKTVEAAKDVVENSGETLEGIKNKVAEVSAEIQEEGKELLHKTEEALHAAKDTVVEKGEELIETAKNTISGEDAAAETPAAEEEHKA